MVWALDFQFDPTIDGKAVTIASMVEEHTRESLLHLVERSITGERVVGELERCSTRPAGGRKCCAWTTARSLFPSAATVLRGQGRAVLSRRARRGTTATSKTTASERSGNRNRWTNLLEARVVIGDFKHQHNHRHRHSALGYLTPAEYAARCRHTHHPVTCEIN